MKVKLTEGQLRNMIAESIKKHLTEDFSKYRKFQGSGSWDDGFSKFKYFDGSNNWKKVPEDVKNRQQEVEKRILDDIINIRSTLWSMKDTINQGREKVWGFYFNDDMYRLIKEAASIIERVFQELSTEEEFKSCRQWYAPYIGKLSNEK